MCGYKMRYIFLTTIFSVVFAYEKDMTFTVQAGKSDCFYQKVLPDEIIDIEYQVIDSIHGDLDISFQMSDPAGRVIVSDYKKPENSHRYTSTMNGDFRFCFDNTFSTFSHKTVFFDMVIDGEDSDEKDYDDDKEMELGTAADTYMMRVRDISESVAKVKDNVSAARRLQELHSAHEARDRNLAEDMCDRAARIVDDEALSDRLDPLAWRSDVGSLCIFYRIYHGECSEELFGLIPAAEFHHQTSRQNTIFHPHHLDVQCSNSAFFKALSASHNHSVEPAVAGDLSEPLRLGYLQEESIFFPERPTTRSK